MTQEPPKPSQSGVQRKGEQQRASSFPGMAFLTSAVPPGSPWLYPLHADVGWPVMQLYLPPCYLHYKAAPSHSGLVGYI